jgi:7-carboxy-7-deazaguanine synthase
MSPKFVVDVVENYRIPYVLITGGEPIEQGKEFVHLVDKLKTRGIHVTVETNGTWMLPTRKLCEVDCYVVDYKMPGAGTEDLFQWSNVPHLTRHDWIKFVISDIEDYDIAKLKYREIYHRNAQPRFAFSPVLNKLSPNDLYTWMLADNIWNVHLSLQLHKIVALPEPR